MSESIIQRDIRLAIGGQDVVIWRNETGATVQVSRYELQALLDNVTDVAFVKRILRTMLARGLISYGLCKGSSDLIGLRRGDGRFVAIEVKKPGGNRRPEQHNFINLVREFGGLAGFAENVEQAKGIIL
jgi:hypothetical protein